MANIQAYLDALVRIRIKNTNKFGSGFVFHSDQTYCYLATCKHVVQGATAGQIELLWQGDRSPCTAEVFCPIEQPALDLQILRVPTSPCLVARRLGLFAYVNDGLDCLAAGFQQFDARGENIRAECHKLSFEGPFRLEPASGTGHSLTLWRLSSRGPVKIGRGCSGGPLIEEQSGRVVGVVSHQVAQGELGCAVPVSYLRQLWPQLPQSVLPEADLTLIQRLSDQDRQALLDFQDVNGFSAKRLGQYCQWCLPDHHPFPPPIEKGLCAILDYLYALGQPQVDAYPLCDFLSLLSSEYAGPHNALLERLALQLATEANYSLRQFEPEPCLPVVTSAMAIELWREQPGSNICLLQGWLYHKQETPVKVLPELDFEQLDISDPVSRSQLVEYIRSQASERGLDPENLLLEFIVDLDLIEIAFEGFTDQIDEAVGSYFPVVMRSRERFTQTSWQLHWKSAWQKLIEYADEPMDTRLQFFCGDMPQLAQWAKNGQLTGFHTPPDPQNSTPRENPLLYLIYSGGAAALWCRDPDVAIADSSSLPQTLKDAKLEALPEALLALRQTSNHGFCLLWDNPARRRPEAVLIAPE